LCGGMSPVDLEGLLNTDGCCSEAGRVFGLADYWAKYRLSGRSRDSTEL
jgi:hypothetical protein